MTRAMLMMIICSFLIIIIIIIITRIIIELAQWRRVFCFSQDCLVKLNVLRALPRGRLADCGLATRLPGDLRPNMGEAQFSPPSIMMMMMMMMVMMMLMMMPMTKI